jgi:putative Mg2+ transporter-C (MgtC) family protein
MVIGIAQATINLGVAVAVGRRRGTVVCSDGGIDGAVNLLLRPLVQRINRQPFASAELQSGYVVSVVCRGDSEAHVRSNCRQAESGALGDGRALAD